mgnify:CR=1 FL=1
MEDIRFEDILLGIFYYLPKGKRQFHYDAEDINRFFYERRDKYPSVLGKKVFNDCGMFPKSEELNLTIANLTYCGFLGSWGIDFDPYEFSAKCRGYFEKSIKTKLSNEQHKNLKDLSGIFEKKFSLERILSADRDF